MYNRKALSLAAVVLIATSAGAQSSAPIRLRASLSGGVGVERSSATHTSALTAGVDIGGSRNNVWGAVKGLVYVEPELIDGGPDYTGYFVGVIAGYRVLTPVSIYAGVGRNSESWSSPDVKSSGMAFAVGVEAVAGRRNGLGARAFVELMQSTTGERRLRFDDQLFVSAFRPQLVHAGIGIVWR